MKFRTFDIEGPFELMPEKFEDERGYFSEIFRLQPFAERAGPVEFVQAKGPHCVFTRHRTGHVTRLGVPESMVAETGEPLV